MLSVFKICSGRDYSITSQTSSWHFALVFLYFFYIKGKSIKTFDVDHIPEGEVVDTCGAGDAFVGGEIISRIPVSLKQNFTKNIYYNNNYLNNY